MRQHHAARLGRRSRRENDLDRIAAPGRRWRKGLRAPARPQPRRNPPAQSVAGFRRAGNDETARQQPPAARPLAPPRGPQIPCRRHVHRHRHGARKNASEKRRDPFARVLAPEQNAVALRDAADLQFPAKLPRRTPQIPVRPAHHAIPAPPGNRRLPRRPRVLPKIFEQGLARHGSRVSQFNLGSPISRSGSEREHFLVGGRACLAPRGCLARVSPSKSLPKTKKPGGNRIPPGL